MSATRASVESTGWQAMKTRRSRSSPDVIVERGLEVSHGVLEAALQLAAQLRLLLLESGAPPEQVDRTVLRSGHQPRTGIVRNAGRGPPLERRDQRVLRQILRQADVADDPGERGDQAG